MPPPAKSDLEAVRLSAPADAASGLAPASPEPQTGLPDSQPAPILSLPDADAPVATFDPETHSFSCPHCGYTLRYASEFVFSPELAGQCKRVTVPFTDRTFPIAVNTIAEAPLPAHFSPDGARRQVLLCDLGCGVGNTSFPLLEKSGGVFPELFDFSARSVEIVRARPRFDGARMTAAVLDATTPHLDPQLRGKYDYVVLIFVLSALYPGAVSQALRNARDLLKPGTGTILFYDYATGDYREQKFNRVAKDLGLGAKRARTATVDQLIAEAEPLRPDGEKRSNSARPEPETTDAGDIPGDFASNTVFVRGERTLATYWEPDFLRAAAEAAGLAIRELRVRETTVVNRKTQEVMRRRFVLGKFKAP
eukprot:gnl/Ergobibamus_cyprinoides/1781.p1 GENE.gnl/Ergobibamus_cyprinoides/1781~~gnl/Ergobibamus_cyprinoides/1781.p1  ORF type:complete len:381 (+),score=103.61 gnl/Ergobibamus_cyprinoides/1781:51-1145(+)